MSVDLDFEQFRVFLEKTCGILLGSNKQYLVASRLNKLMEQHGITSVLVTEPAPPGQAPLLRGLVRAVNRLRGDDSRAPRA